MNYYGGLAENAEAVAGGKRTCGSVHIVCVSSGGVATRRGGALLSLAGDSCKAHGMTVLLGPSTAEV